VISTDNNSFTQLTTKNPLFGFLFISNGFVMITDMYIIYENMHFYLVNDVGNSSIINITNCFIKCDYEGFR
jgi:hypothetical protein